MDLNFEQYQKLAEQHGTPLYVISRKKLAENYNRLKSLLPRVRLFYAMKANHYEPLLKEIRKLGAGFDVASGLEVQRAFDAGAGPDDMIFANTIKKESSIRLAAQKGTKLFSFDNESELDKLSRGAPGVDVLLRLAVPNEGSQCHLSEKFGADFTAAIPLLKKAKHLGLNPRGIAFHVGSQCQNPTNFATALELTKRLFDSAAKEGMKLDFLSIGGGFPVRYTNEEFDIEEMCRVINQELEEHFKGVEVIAEPGRFIVGDAITLLVGVVGVANRGGKHWLYLDDGCYGSFIEAIMYKQKFTFLSSKQGKKMPYVLAGPTCDSVDIIGEAELPEMQIDDILIVPSMGAYAYSESTQFNGFYPQQHIFVD